MAVNGLKHTAGIKAAYAPEEGIVAQNGWVLLWALFGLLFPRAGAYQVLSPFGIGLVGAVSGAGSALVGLTASIGYLLLADVSFPLRYIGTIALIGGIRWAFCAFPKLVRHVWFSPLLVFVTTAASGLFTARLFAGNLSAGWLSVSEAAAAAVVTAVVRPVIDAASDGLPFDEYPTAARTGWLLLGAVTFMALSGVRISVITPANIMAGIVVLMLANTLHERGGAILGITVAVALILMHPDRWQLAFGYAFGGLIAGAFARFGRPATVSAWAVATTVIALSGGSDTAFLIGVYETLAAGVLYLLVPHHAERGLARCLFGNPACAVADGFRRSIATKLDLASRVMEEVSATVDTVARQIEELGASDIGSVYRDAAEDVCRDCASKMSCWKRYYSDTMASFNDLTPLLREKSTVGAGEIRGHLARSCPRLDEMAQQISRRYTEYHVRESGARRLREIQSVVRGQFSGMSGIFSQFATDLATLKRVDTDTAARILDVCEQYRMPIVDAVCLIDANGRITVEMLSEDSTLHGNVDEWLAAIADLCGKPFCRPVTTPLSGGTKVTLHQATRYAAAVGAAQHVCEGETVCGDAYEYFEDEEGRVHVILSDGMGSGGRAAVDGAMTAGLTARMLGAGFGMDNVVPILNSALMVGAEDETAATLDVLTLDLFTGDIRLIKAGACSTLLISRGRVSRLHTETLPIGILQTSLYAQLDERLADGDVLLMMSDGAAPDGDEWLVEWLEHDPPPADMETLAQWVVDRALCRQEHGHKDDITVLAVKIEKRGG